MHASQGLGPTPQTITSWASANMLFIVTAFWVLFPLTGLYLNVCKSMFRSSLTFNGSWSRNPAGLWTQLQAGQPELWRWRVLQQAAAPWGRRATPALLLWRRCPPALKPQYPACCSGPRAQGHQVLLVSSPGRNR